MDSSDQQQSCAICLDILLPEYTTNTKIGALVPCGHVFHRSCWNRWYSAHKRRTAGIPGGDKKCKCPMCNAPCDKFVQLFLGEKQESTATKTTLVAKTTAASDDDASESIVLLAKTCHDSAKRLDRVKDKLHKYKRENKALEVKLREERRAATETLERSTERHSKDRRAWKRQQVRLQDELKNVKESRANLQQELEDCRLEQERERRKWKRQSLKLEQKLAEELHQSVAAQAQNVRDWGQQRTSLQSQLAQTQAENDALRVEIDRTIELQVQERRAKEEDTKRLKQELAQARGAQQTADAKVQRAVQGIAQMRAYHELRKEQMERLVKEKEQLQEELRKMKEASTGEGNEEVLFTDDS